MDDGEDFVRISWKNKRKDYLNTGYNKIECGCAGSRPIRIEIDEQETDPNLSWYQYFIWNLFFEIRNSSNAYDFFRDI